MNYGQLQTYLSQKLGTSETINLSDTSRKQAINDALLNDVQEFAKWKELQATKPLTFLRRGRLICGVTPLTAYTDWTGITDGSIRITVDGTGYNVDGIDFSTAADMDGVATLLQTAIQTATGGNETVDYYTDYFVISSGTTGGDSSIAVLETTTGTEGTDISGGSYLNGVDGSSTSYCTSAIPSDYREMITLYSSTDGNSSNYGWEYTSPEDFTRDISRAWKDITRAWTVQDLFGTSMFYVNSDVDITLFARYRKSLVSMSLSDSTTGLTSNFDEPIVLIAAAKLFSQKNPEDIRIRIYEDRAKFMLGNLYKKNYENSQNYNKTIPMARTRINTYSY